MASSLSDARACCSRQVQKIYFKLPPCNPLKMSTVSADSEKGKCLLAGKCF